MFTSYKGTSNRLCHFIYKAESCLVTSKGILQIGGNKMETGQVCYKIAGRDAGGCCVILEVIDKNYVTIDGETRRKKCNIKHLEPINVKIKADKNTSKEEILKLLEKQELIKIKKQKIIKNANSKTKSGKKS